MDKYKVGIIGCGRVASLLEHDKLREHPCTHAGAYAAVDKTEIVAGCDINEDRLRRFGKEWGAKALYEDYREMLERQDLDIVSVCTWGDTHPEITIAAAEAGVKGIICEKPIALSLTEADQMIETVKRCNTALVINHERRWSSNYHKAKELIEEGVIGKVELINANTLSGGYGCVWDSKSSPVILEDYTLVRDGTHLMDMLTFFAGEPAWVSGFVEMEPRETGVFVSDVAHGIIHFKSGVIASVESSGGREYFNFELDIQGSRGRILIGNEALAMWETDVSPRYEGFWELAERPFPAPAKQKNIFIGGVEDIIECIETGKESISSGNEARMALEMIMALYESARQDGVKVKIPLTVRSSPLETIGKKSGYRFGYR